MIASGPPAALWIHHILITKGPAASRVTFLFQKQNRGRGSTRLVGRTANRGMLRLESSPTAILDSRSRQPLWRELRSSGAGCRNTASSYAGQVARANAVAERWVRSARFECLDYLVVFSEANLRRVLSAYVTYYNRWRPPRSLGRAVPCGEARPLHSASMPKDRRGICGWLVTPHLPRCCMTSFCAPQRRQLVKILVS
jgi:hypothetical protein